MNKKIAKKKILKDFPNFIVENIEKIGEGMDSIAYLVNNNFIFRFPKSLEIRQNLAKEIAVLPFLQRQLNIKIPDFEFIGSENSFVGYQKIDGEFLTKEVFYSFAKSEQDKIQKSLADFLLTVHQQNIVEYEKGGVEIQDFRAEYQESFEATKVNVFPIISAEHQKFIENQFRQYLENDENFSYKPTLVHNDLSADHILVNDSREITGIIDFGDIAIGDSDYDLMYLLDDYGEDFVRSFLKYYSHPNHSKLFSKLYFWCLVDTLQPINHYTEENNTKEIKQLLKYLSDWISLMKSNQATRTHTPLEIAE